MAQEEGVLRWWPRVKLAWPYASWLATTLFIVGGIAGLFLAFRAGVRNPIGFVFSIADPAAAALLLMLCSLAAPDLYRPYRLTPFHVFAFPILSTLGILIYRLVITPSAFGLMGMADLVRLDRQWSNIIVLGLLGLIQMIVLLVFWAVASRREPDKLP